MLFVVVVSGFCYLFLRGAIVKLRGDGPHLRIVLFCSCCYDMHMRGKATIWKQKIRRWQKRIRYGKNDKMISILCCLYGSRSPLYYVITFSQSLMYRALTSVLFYFAEHVNNCDQLLIGTQQKTSSSSNRTFVVVVVVVICICGERLRNGNKIYVLKRGYDMGKRIR